MLFSSPTANSTTEIFEELSNVERDVREKRARPPGFAYRLQRICCILEEVAVLKFAVIADLIAFRSIKRRIDVKGRQHLAA